MSSIWCVLPALHELILGVEVRNFSPPKGSWVALMLPVVFFTVGLQPLINPEVPAWEQKELPLELRRANITWKGALTPSFEYIDYLRTENEKGSACTAIFFSHRQFLPSSIVDFLNTFPFGLFFDPSSKVTLHVPFPLLPPQLPPVFVCGPFLHSA